MLALATVLPASVASARRSAARHGGYVLDAWGALHAFGGADPAVSPAYWPGRDLARGVAVVPGGGGWVLDAWGGVHPFGRAANIKLPVSRRYIGSIAAPGQTLK
ncbi:MAG: hypothetical protein ABJC79_00140 [Acidimicrobiia bacterium]